RENIKDKVLNLVKQIESEPFKAFKTVNNLNKNKKGITAISVNGKIISDPENCKKKVATFWKKLFFKKAPKSYLPKWLLKKDKININSVQEGLLIKITFQEVKELIMCLFNGKTAGWNEIHIEMLKSLSDEAIHHLVDIMNESLLKKSIPNEWKHVKIYPIFKNNGNEFDMDNFHPIALLSVPYKIYSFIINKKLTAILE